MFWREIGVQRYLIQVASHGAQSSLGSETPELLAIHERFKARKEICEQRLRSLKAAVLLHQRLNRALSVGRAPNLLINTLNRLDQAGLSQHFLIVSTYALFDYESACGVRVEADATETHSFVTTMERLDQSLLSIFQKIDKTFELRSDQPYTAVNADGFEIDVVRREVKGTDPHPLRVSTHKEDFWAVQISTGPSLLDGGHFEQAVVLTNGHMAMMRVPAPANFVRI